MRLSRTRRYQYGKAPRTSASGARKEDDDGGGGCSAISCLLVVVSVAVVGIVVALWLMNKLPGSESPLDPPEPPPPIPSGAANGTLEFLNTLDLSFSPSCAAFIPGTSWVYLCNPGDNSLELFLVEGVTGTWTDQNYSVSTPAVSLYSSAAFPDVLWVSADGYTLYVAYNYVTGHGWLTTFAVDVYTGNLLLLNSIGTTGQVLAVVDDGVSVVYVTDASSTLSVYINNGPGVGLVFFTNFSTSPTPQVSAVAVNNTLYTLGGDAVLIWPILFNGSLGPPTTVTQLATTVAQLVVSDDGGSTLYVIGRAIVAEYAINQLTGALTLVTALIDGTLGSACAVLGMAFNSYIYTLQNATALAQLAAPSLSYLSPSAVSVPGPIVTSPCSVLVLYDAFVSLLDESQSTITTWGVAPLYGADE